MASTATAPRAIPGASADGQQREMSSGNSSNTSTSTAAPPTTTTTASPPPPKSTSARRHSYVPRWDANGNSHHPIPSTSSTMSNKNTTNSIDNSTVSSPPSAILSLLGLSPSPKRSAAVPLPPVGSSNHAGHGHGHGHARNNPSISSTTSTAYYDTTEDNLLDGDFDDDDGPPEPITPPQSTLAPLTTSSTQEGAAKSGKTAAAVVGHNKPARTATPTHFGNELDEASKFELDDVFDGNASIGSIARSPPPSISAHSAGNTNNNNAGIPVPSSSNSGRRASWSAASGNGAQHVYSASAPGTSLMSWLHSQQQSHTQNHQQAAGASSSYNINPDKTSVDLGRGARPIPIDQQQQHGSTNAGGMQTAPAKEATDFGSSPVGLFRRLSLSYTNRRPSVPAPPSTASQLSGDNNHNNADDPRIGRPLTRVTSAPPRKLSPMGERMLRAHYDSFS